VVDIIRNGTVVAVINTVTGGRVPMSDGFEIRRTAAEKRIPCFTSLDTVAALADILGNGRLTVNIKPLKEYRDGN